MPLTTATPVPPIVTRDVPTRGADRRRWPTPLWSRHVWFGGRRHRGGRRAGEDGNCFVDLHGERLFAVVLVVALLNFLDAWYTVLFLSHGATELNPIVDSLLGLGTWPFLLAKSAGIGLCCVVLTLTKNFAIARSGLGIVFAGYTVLLGWHLSLLHHIAE